ncbi:MAG: nicotinate-nucleotide adenylyltransferase [Candidatus Bathyarchaeota archaeon]|nr:nicotinate-nucleotide adenylyltransferase [Candidatus Bathyarchaeota archaeon]
MKLGILGGTFDPIHMGHLIIAQEAAVRAALDEVWFIPTGQPWLKSGTRISPSDHRLEMVRRATRCNPGFKVSALEVDRPGPTYTVDTLESLREGAAKGDDLFLILGMDSLETLHRWHRPERLFDLCTLIGVSRPEHGDFDLSSLDKICSGASGQVAIIDGPSIGISGAEIRRRVSQGLPITYWVPRAVEEYIHNHNLYQEADYEQ